jgi:hypothetical protein
LFAIPDNISATRDALVFEEGKKPGRSSKSWMKEPPRLDDLERVAVGEKQPSK